MAARVIARRLLAAAGALTTGLLLAALGAEGVLRAYPRLLPEQVRQRLHWRELLDGEALRTVPDPDLGFRFVAGEGEYDLRDLSFTYRIDARGYRNASPPPQEAQVVVLGDSLGFGFGVDDDHTWSRLVDDGLAGARVANLALPGYGPEQYARTWERVGAALHPELVIVAVFAANDVQDQALFRRWVDAGSPGNYGTWRFEDDGLRARSYLWSLIDAARRDEPSPYVDERLELREGPMNVTPRIVARSARAARRGHPDFLSAIGSLARLETSARAAGVRTLFVLFPCKEEVYLPALGRDTPQPTRPFAALFRQRRYDFVDLTPVFQERAEERERLYFEVDNHPNARGNALAAEAVLDWIHTHLDLR